MRKYFLLSVILFFLSGCTLFKPIYFTPAPISQVSKQNEKEIDKIKWIGEDKKANLVHRGFIVSKSYDSIKKLWKYHFESLEYGEYLDFYYDKKLGYDNDLIEVTLKKEADKNILDKIKIIKENYKNSNYAETFFDKSSLKPEKKLKKRTLNRLNRTLGVPTEEKIDIK